MFWQLQALGCSDDRFSYENFGNQPDWLIFQALEFFQRQNNQTNRIHAIGWTSLLNGFSSKDAEKIESWQLLPYPSVAQQQQKRLSDRTAGLLAALVQSEKLPRRIAVLVQQFDELSSYLDDPD